MIRRPANIPSSFRIPFSTVGTEVRKISRRSGPRRSRLVRRSRPPAVEDCPADARPAARRWSRFKPLSTTSTRRIVATPTDALTVAELHQEIAAELQQLRDLHGLGGLDERTIRLFVRSSASISPHAIRPGWREGSGGAAGPSKQTRHLPFRETIGIPAVSQVGAPLAAILQSARTMQQIMNANVLERRLRINLKCLHQHTAIAALAHGT